MDDNNNEDSSSPSQKNTLLDKLEYELNYIKRSISIAYPILEIIKPNTTTRDKEKEEEEEEDWLVLCNGYNSSNTSIAYQWIQKAFNVSYNKRQLFPKEHDIIHYAVSNGYANTIDDALLDIHKTQESSDNHLIRTTTTRRLVLKDPCNNNNKEEGTTTDVILCLPICTLLCVDEIVISVKYLIKEEVYPSLDNIKYILHMAFSLSTITHNDILACARFGVEQGRLFIGKDIILPIDTTDDDVAITSYTCYPLKYTPSSINSSIDNELMGLVEGFYKAVKETTTTTTSCYCYDDDESTPLQLALLIKMLRYDNSNVTLGKLRWLFQRCILLNNNSNHKVYDNLLSSYYIPHYPLWSITTKDSRKKVEIHNAAAAASGSGKESNNTNIINKHDKEDTTTSTTTAFAAPPAPGGVSVNTSPISAVDSTTTNITVTGSGNDSSNIQHNNNNEIYDDAALAREQLLFIHCFKNELLAGQGILLNQVNNLCKVRCGRSVKYREFRYGKLRDFLEDIKGLQVMGEKFQMTIRLTDVVEFDLFIRQANVRKIRGYSHTTLTTINNERGGDYDTSLLSNPSKDNIADDNDVDGAEAELKHISLPQLIPDNIIDKLRYMFACEHYQIEASVFVSLFKNRYFSSDPMVYERLGYKRMRDFLGAVPQVHKHGTKSEAKYVWVENSAPLKLGAGQFNIGNSESSSSIFNTSSSTATTTTTAIDFIHSTIPPSSNTYINNIGSSSSSCNTNTTALPSDNIIDNILNEVPSTSLSINNDDNDDNDIVEIAIFDVVTGICTGASNGLERLFGFSLTGINFYKLIHPDDSISVRMKIDEAIGIGHNNVNLSTFRLRATTTTTTNRNGIGGRRINNSSSITVSGTVSLLMGTLWTLSLVILD